MKTPFLVLLLSLTVASAPARPVLKLGASPAAVDPQTQMAVPQSKTFTLYALVDAASPAAQGLCFISAAISPAPVELPAELGSFTFDGQTIPLTAGMAYGSPKLIAPRPEFPTWYREFGFIFDPTRRTLNYTPSGANQPVYHSRGDVLYREFEVDVSGLPEGITVVFDLYTYDQPTDELLPLRRLRHATSPGGELTGDGPRPVQVPDALSTLPGLSLGLLGLYAARRLRLRRCAASLRFED